MISTIQARAFFRPAKFALRALRAKMPTKVETTSKPSSSILDRFEAMLSHQTDLVFRDINID